MEQIEPTNLTTKTANLPGRKKINNLKLRANMPAVLRGLALIALFIVILGIGYAFYRGGDASFRVRGGPTELSKDVVSVVNGYERREMDGNKVKFYIKADKTTTYSDQHREMENVYLQSFDDKSDKFDQITAKKMVFVPNPSSTKLFDAYFTGSVDIETRDALQVKTEQLDYNKESETARSDEAIEFKQNNLEGKSLGAILKMSEKKVELLKNVEMNAEADSSVPDDKVTKANLQSIKIVSDHAVIWQNEGKMEADQNVFINLVPLNKPGSTSQPTDIKSDKLVAGFVEKKLRTLDLTGNVEIYSKPTPTVSKYTKTRSNHVFATIDRDLQTAELNDNVYIETTKDSEKPTIITSQYAFYSKPEDKFDLKDNVVITTQQENKPTVTHSNTALYLQTQGKIFLTGAAQVTQGNDLLKGDSIAADLYPNKKLQNAYSRGNAYLKQVTPERTTEASANEMNAFYNEAEQIQKANVIGNGNVTIIPSNQQEYTKFTMSAPKSIELSFQPNAAESVLSQMLTEGRTTINMLAPQGKPDAANKKIIADNVKTIMNKNGKDLVRAEAVGNAELYVNPLQSRPDNYNSVVTAPRMDCDFYETGNNARLCIASTKAKAVMTPTVASENHGTRTMWGDKLAANFNQNTHDIERFEAFGNSKFTELDRTGIANQFVYTAGDQVVRLRGGEPTVWDSRARARASEIDWDTKNQKSFLRTKVATTYYSQKSTNGATPFGKTNSPVFVTSEQAQFDHQREIGIYTGNARAWQDNNYVRANELTLFQKEQRMEGEGKVQSLLYNATRKENGKTINEPAFAASDKFYYTDKDKLLHFENNVDTRQGTDRMTAGITDIYLDGNNNVKQTISQNNVVITQPNRRVSGNWIKYNAADDTAIVRGNPANMIDREQGSTQGSEITVLMRENKVINQGAAKTGNGRTRTVYNVKTQ